jgi:hypothetical protein
MLHSRHFAGKPLIGKGLKRFPATLHCGDLYIPAHHLGVNNKIQKKNRIVGDADSIQYISRASNNSWHDFQ